MQYSLPVALCCGPCHRLSSFVSTWLLEGLAGLSRKASMQRFVRPIHQAELFLGLSEEVQVPSRQSVNLSPLTWWGGTGVMLTAYLRLLNSWMVWYYSTVQCSAAPSSAEQLIDAALPTWIIPWLYHSAVLENEETQFIVPCCCLCCSLLMTPQKTHCRRLSLRLKLTLTKPFWSHLTPQSESLIWIHLLSHKFIKTITQSHMWVDFANAVWLKKGSAHQLHVQLRCEASGALLFMNQWSHMQDDPVAEELFHRQCSLRVQLSERRIKTRCAVRGMVKHHMTHVILHSMAKRPLWSFFFFTHYWLSGLW